MQWKGYLPYEASWEPEEGILPRCEELFNRPSPDVAIIPENVCSFRVTVERHLKSRSLLPVRFCFLGMFFVSCLLVRECRGRDGHFLKKMISMLFIFLLGEIPGWILMAKE